MSVDVSPVNYSDSDSDSEGQGVTAVQNDEIEKKSTGVSWNDRLKGDC